MQNRRQFLNSSFAALTVSQVALHAQERVKLKKAVKIGMIEGKSFEDKFSLIKKLGFLGVEMDSPGCNEAQRAEAKAAAEKTGITIHGVVISTHWGVRHSDPKPETREQAMENLKGALDDAKFWGASTVLLVPGAVKNEQEENYDQVWERSTAAVKEALPYAEKCGVKIAIEVVWNNFITKPEQLMKYVDQFNSPWVGAYFDCSNMVKYGVASEEWIRLLGKRIFKFDFKAYSIAKAKEAGKEGAGFGVKIGEGDENWPAILKALDEIGYPTYSGWATSEVGGGGEAHLKDVAARMDKVLGLV